MYLQKTTTKRMEWNIDKVVEEEENSQGRNELKIEQGSLKQMDRIPTKCPFCQQTLGKMAVQK